MIKFTLFIEENDLVELYKGTFKVRNFKEVVCSMQPFHDLALFSFGKVKFLPSYTSLITSKSAI
jgi:hypothetical protein